MVGDPFVRLLIDQNLAAGLARHLADVFPGSRHVRDFGLRTGTDAAIAEVARREGFVILTKDGDFARSAWSRGALPKVILLRLGNCSTREIVSLLRERQADIVDLERGRRGPVLELP
jgi:predicted nuclease of predicted toxin-antitoxin system